MRKVLVATALIVTLVATMVIGACGSSTTSATPTAGSSSAGSTPAAKATTATNAATTASTKTQGITDTEIKVGAYHSLNGAISSVSLQTSKSAKAYFSYINDQGGINGRKINYLVEDNGGDAQKALAATKKLVEQEKVFIMVYGQNSPEAMVTRPYLVQQGIGHLMVGCPLSECVAPASGWYTAWYPYDKEAADLVNYAIKDLKLSKIGVFYLNNDYGKDNLKGVKAAVDASGGAAKMAAEVAINTGDTDMSAGAIKMKSGNVDVIYCAAYSNHINALWQEMKKLGFTPVMMGTQAFGVSTLAPLMGDDTEGFYTTYTPTPDLTSDGDASVKVYKEAVSKYAADIDATNPNNYKVFQMMTAAGEIMKLAGKDLSNATIDKAALSLKDYGPLKLTYTADNHAGITSSTIARWNKDKVVPLADYKKP